MTRRGQRVQKGLDAFQKQTLPLVQWLSKHQWTVWGIFSLLFLSVVGVWAFQEFKGYGSNKRLEELSKIDLKVSEEILRVSKLREPYYKELQALVEKKGDDVETKKKELEQKASSIKPDYAQFFDEYAAFFQKYKSYPEAWGAGLRVGVTALRENFKNEEALKLVSDITVLAKSDTVYPWLAHAALSAYFEDQSNFDKALEHIEKALSSNLNVLKPNFLLAKSRILIAKNDKEAALANLDIILKEHASSQEVNKARAMKSLL